MNLLTDKDFRAMREWRHDIHRHPELAFEERRTADKVAALLDEFGLEVHRDIGRTGVVGLLRSARRNTSPGKALSTAPRCSSSSLPRNTARVRGR